MPPLSMPSTSTSGPPIMKSVWTVESLKPSASASASTAPSDPRRPRDPLAVRDVTGGVLVEQRVEEDDPGLADAGLAVDERDLAEVGGALVGPHLLADDVGARRRRPPRRRARREAQGEVAHDLTVHHQRHGRADDTFGAQPVRGREDLLGRHVDDVRRIPSSVSSAPVSQRDSGIRPTVRSVPGPRKRIASNRRSSSRAARSRRRAMCSCQAATGSGSSSRVAIATASQSRSTSGSPKTAFAQPAFG